MTIPKLWTSDQPVPKLTFTDLHLHTEYSLKDGAIRICNKKDPKHIKADIVLNAERRGTGAITATDHGNMYGHAVMASVAKNFGLKHIPACEFYMAIGSRFERGMPKSEAYVHINAWAKNRNGYANLCRLQSLSFASGFYYQPRIDKELIDKYGDDIVWSDACVGGTISSLICNGKIEQAKSEFMWYMDRFKSDFVIEYHNHGIEEETMVNNIKVEWANTYGVPVIAATDAHFSNKEDEDAHKTLLCIQYANWLDNPTFCGFPGSGYWLMSNEELLMKYPVEYLNNTQLIVDKVEHDIIEFGKITPPIFKIPQYHINRRNNNV